MASTRLPDKPLAMIGNKPMICHVVDRAMEAGIGTPWVATDSEKVRDAVTAYGSNAVMTRDDHPSGSDRIWEAVCKIDPEAEAKYVVNVQGDLPTIEPHNIRASLNPLLEGDADLATLGCEIHEESEKTNPNVVKIVGAPLGADRLNALYFTRATAPWGDGPLYHHIGLYAYRRSALERFVSLPPSQLEMREKLEQLRALEAGMKIQVSIVDAVPLGVDTIEDLERARAVFDRL